jgi:acetylornithine deacetylase/succinyl-diaminopimelate desuccinylase-like protein
MASPEEFTGPTTELLQGLIRNECVNDGTPDSGHETRNADLLQQYLEGGGLAVERLTPRAGRDSIVARIEGSDPDAPSLCLMGHTDVVPVNPDGWEHDPFAGEVIDGEVWGRGALDMLNLTSSMAVVVRRLADEGFTPRGDLVYFGVGDEEAGGVHGAEWIAEHHWDVIEADYVLTEFGGWSAPAADGSRRVTVNVGEKGLAWRRLRVSGTPGHGSIPFGSDNALVKAAEVVRRLSEYRPEAHIDEVWEAQLAALDLPPELAEGLRSPERIWETLHTLPTPVARLCHAQTHTTFSPNVCHGGQKTNTIPDVIDIDVDIRTVPGTTRHDVDAHLREALGGLYDEVEVSVLQQADPTASPRGAGNPLWDAVSKHTQVAFPGATLVPGLIVGGTDARFYRERGKIAYGTGLFSPSVDAATFGSRFHGNNERIDLASLGLTGNYFYGIVTDLLG